MLLDREAALVFAQFTEIQVGDGMNTLFWKDKWFRGRSIHDLALVVAAAVSRGCAGKRMVKEAMLYHSWIKNVRGRLTEEGIVQCMKILVSM